MYQKTTLPNGLRVVTSTMPYTRSVSVYFFLGIGSRFESDAEAGMSHFVEHMLFKGTPKRPTSIDISAAIEGVGGSLNGGTDKELTVYWARVAQPHFRLALDVLSDFVLKSKFDPVELERERQVVIEEINMTKDTPSQQAHIIMDELLWPDHPLGRDILGSKKSVKGITREAMLDYVNAEYLPSRSVVAIAGNIEHDEAVKAVAESVADWESSGEGRPCVTYTDRPNPRLRVKKRDTEQVHVCIAVPGIDLHDPRRFALDLGNAVLGEGMSSRLFTEVRDKLGLAYSIHSFTDHFMDTGSLTIYAGADPGNLKVMVGAITHELSRMLKTVPVDELNRAKELTKGRLMLRMEDTRSVAGFLGEQELLMGRIMTVDDIVQTIDDVTAEQVRAILRETLVTERLRMAIVGPVKDQSGLEDLLKI